MEQQKLKTFCRQAGVVTGGMSGIGLACVETLLLENIHKIAILDVMRNDQVLERLSAKFPERHIVFILTDVSNKIQVDAAFERIKRQFGNINVVINSAGIMNEKTIERVLSINIGGVMYSTLAALAAMSKASGGVGGCVVNISSVAALTTIFYCPIYVATKHAVLSFTSSMAHEYHYEHTGIKFMSVCPGATETNLLKCKNEISSHLRFPWIYDIADNIVATEMTFQPAKSVASCVVEAIKQDKNGSIWMSVDKTNSEISVPDNPHLCALSELKSFQNPCPEVEEPEDYTCHLVETATNTDESPDIDETLKTEEDANNLVARETDAATSTAELKDWNERYIK